MMRPRSSTTTAPTQGFGEASPMPLRASSSASRMKSSSAEKGILLACPHSKKRCTVLCEIDLTKLSFEVVNGRTFDWNLKLGTLGTRRIQVVSLDLYPDLSVRRKVRAEKLQ